MSYLIGLFLGTLFVSVWSYRRGTGFWFGFLWSFLLSPILGAVLVLLRRPRPTVLVRGGIAVGADSAVDPSAPRPLFCLLMTVVLTLIVLVWINADAIRMNIAFFLLEM